MNERIKYIDNLKAFAIFCVIISHVYTFTFNIEARPLVLQIITSFYMPLFFFISGMFAKDDFSIKKIMERSQQLLIPSIVVSVLFCRWSGSDVKNAFLSESHWGFWFLPTLWIITIIWQIRDIITRKFGRVSLFIFDAFFVVSIFVLSQFLCSILPSEISNLLLLRPVAKYCIYYWLGYYSYKFLLPVVEVKPQWGG